MDPSCPYGTDETNVGVSDGSRSAITSTGETWTCWSTTSLENQVLEYLSQEERLKERLDCSSQRREDQEGRISVYKYLLRWGLQ